MMRELLEKIGVIEPRDEEVREVRSTAMQINEDARREIHASRERRAVLQLRLEHELRKGRQH